MGQQLTIGLVSSTYWPIIGGAEIYLRQLAHVLARKGHRVVVSTRFTVQRPCHMRLFLATSSSGARYHDGEVEVTVVSPGLVKRQLQRPLYRLLFYPQTQPAAVRLFCAAYYQQLRDVLTGCDVIHYSGTGRELLGFCALQVARALGVPMVVTSHMHVGQWGDGDLDFELYRQADALIALTQYERQHLMSRGVSPARVHVLGHGVNVTGGGSGERFRNAHGIVGPMILFLGRQAGYKGYPLLLEAAPTIWKYRPDVQIVFAGPHDPSLEISPAISTIAGDARIRQVGVLTDSEREDAYAACDVFCLPSRAEAYGLVYLEAWAYGKPVVALDIPTLNELIGGTSGGLLAQDDAGAVADAVVQLLRDDEMYRQMAENGHHKAAHSTWECVGDQLDKVYRSTLTAT